MPIVANTRGTEFCEQIQFFIEQCCNCGVPFALSSETYRRRKADGESFYCPNGHPQQYCETTETKLRREVAQERQKRDQAEAEARVQKAFAEQAQRNADKAKKETARIKKRAAGGVCPCCNRHFPDLHSHMSVKHPDAMKEAGVSLAMSRKRK